MASGQRPKNEISRIRSGLLSSRLKHSVMDGKGSDNKRIIQAFVVNQSTVICQTTGPQPLPKRFLHLM